jgi:hypothetical protein
MTRDNSILRLYRSSHQNLALEAVREALRTLHIRNLAAAEAALLLQLLGVLDGCIGLKFREYN